MSNYVQSTNFATKDALSSGDPLKIVRGTEINTEFNNIATAVATKADLASPTFTGTVTGTFVGNLTGNVTGTATTLQTARNINGTSFNGSADITTNGWGATRAIWGQNINGTTDITAPIRPAAGSQAAPAFSTSGDTDTGIFFPAANSLALVTEGKTPVRVNALGNVLIAPDNVTTDNFARVSIIAPPPAGGLGTANDFSYGLQVNHFFSIGFAKNYILFGTQASEQGSIRSSTGVGVQYNTSSDYRLKDNVRPISGGLDRVMRLKPCEWNWKINGSAGVGFIAHEVQAERPQAVSGEKDAVNAKGLPVHQGIDASYLIADLTAAIQELKAIVDAQAVEIAALKNS